jgi:hypothetical protein
LRGYGDGILGRKRGKYFSPAMGSNVSVSKNLFYRQYSEKATSFAVASFSKATLTGPFRL